MLPIQEIEIHADRDAKITVHIEFHRENNKFGSGVTILDRKSDLYASSKIHFGNDHDTAMDAFEAAFGWVAQWSTARDRPIIGMNNPCNCEFLSVEAQRLVSERCGVNIPITVTAWI